jgi:hypothetical protein
MPKRLRRHAFNQPHLLSVGSRRLLQFIRRPFYMSDLATPHINGVGPRASPRLAARTRTHTHSMIRARLPNRSPPSLASSERRILVGLYRTKSDKVLPIAVLVNHDREALSCRQVGVCSLRLFDLSI